MLRKSNKEEQKRILIFFLIFFFCFGMFWNMFGPIAFWHETGHVLSEWSVGVAAFWKGPKVAGVGRTRFDFQDEVIRNAGYFGEILILFILTLLCVKYGANILAFYFWGQYHCQQASTIANYQLYERKIYSVLPSRNPTERPAE
jgi:hypothetical protein